MGSANCKNLSKGSVRAPSLTAVHPRAHSHWPSKKASEPTEAAMRADTFLEEGNLDGQRMWLRILTAIEELQRIERQRGEAIH